MSIGCGHVIIGQSYTPDLVKRVSLLVYPYRQHHYRVATDKTKRLCRGSDKTCCLTPLNIPSAFASNDERASVLIYGVTTGKLQNMTCTIVHRISLLCNYHS